MKHNNFNKINENISSFSKHILILIVASVLLIIACKKNDRQNFSFNINDLKYGPPPITLPTANSELEIENQYRWIARGYVGYLSNLTYRNWIAGNLLTQDFYENSHDTVNLLSNTYLNIDLEDEIFANVNSVFPNNDYLRGYFYGFNFENCLYTTKIRLVDTPNLSLPWIVTYQSLTYKDTVWGYFQDSIGNLDSTEICSQNFEDYLIYCVFPSSQCSEGRSNAYVTGGCNENGVCEPYQGETEENCADCSLNKQKIYQKRLEVANVTILEDKKEFDEAWAQGRYFLAWDWAIVEDNTGIIHGTRDDQDFIYNIWKRNEVKVCRKSCKGTPTEKQNKWSNLMYNNFEPTKEDIYILFWEDDIRKKHQRTMKAMNNLNIQFIQADFDNLWWPVYKGGSFHSVQNGNAGDGIVYIPKGSVWFTDPSNPKRHTIEMQNPSGEIKIKLAYFDF